MTDAATPEAMELATSLFVRMMDTLDPDAVVRDAGPDIGKLMYDLVTEERLRAYTLCVNVITADTAELKKTVRPEVIRGMQLAAEVIGEQILNGVPA